MTKIGILGMGNMGSAIALTLAEKDKYKIYSYTKDKKFTNHKTTLNSIDNIVDITKQTDILILCVKPNQYQDLCKKITKPVKLISILAGVKIQDLKKNLPIQSKIVRVMPNIALLVRKSFSTFYGDSELYSETEEIFSYLGTTWKVKDESIINTATGLSGSGIAYILDFIDGLNLSGVYNGLNYKESMSIVLKTIEGCLELLKQNDIEPTQFRNKVMSPGGTTVEGFKFLEKSSFKYILMEAVTRSIEKSKRF